MLVCTTLASDIASPKGVSGPSHGGAAWLRAPTSKNCGVVHPAGLPAAGLPPTVGEPPL